MCKNVCIFVMKLHDVSMAVNEEFIPSRKAFSAEKSKDLIQSVSSENGFDEICNRTFKVCSSASYLSARERRHEQQILDTSLLENFSPKYFKTNGKANQKLFLQSSQILEKLNKIIISANDNSLSDDIFTNKKLSLQKIILYHDKLKKLMIERSSVSLLEECDVFMKREIKLIKEFKQLYVNEKLKMTTMPMQAFNRFISSSDINVSSLELLVKKLKAICDMHICLNGNYQNIINRFHIGIDVNFHENFLKINDVLLKLKIDAFYWSQKCVELFLQKLCLADPNSISPEFLQLILKCIYAYNSLVNSNKVKFKLSKISSIFYDFNQHHEYDISFNFILQYLSFFEAKVAAERIVNFITSSCKKYRQADLKRKQLFEDHGKGERKIINNDSTVFESGLEKSNLKLLISDSLSSNFVNALLSIMQRNQSLVLKYMFAFTSLENIIMIKGKNEVLGNKSPDTPARQMWDLPQLYNKDENYVHLEEQYWINFWSNIKKFILKLLLDVPYHQYGDSASGTIILWPESFLSILSENLKISSENNDLSLDGRQTMREIYDYLIIHQAKLCWDKEFSISLSATQSHLCPVVTLPNQMRTFPGNSLNKCLSILLETFPVSIHEMDSTLYLPVFLHLQALLDTYNLWMNNKTRTLIASQNIPTYLLISSSDCSVAKQELEDKAVCLISKFDSLNIFRRFHPLHALLYENFFKQIDILCGYVHEATTIIFNYYFITVKELLLFIVENSSKCRFCFKTEIKNVTFETVDDILSPVTHTLSNVTNTYDIIQSITIGTSGAFLFVLENENRLWNFNTIQIIHNEYIKFLKWLEKVNLSHSNLEKLKHLYQIGKLTSIMKFIQNFYTSPRNCFRRRNQVAPQFQLERVSTENILSDQEQVFWKEKCNKSKYFSCI